MLNRLLTSVFGSRNERLLKQLGGIVRKINALEPQMQALSDDALKAKTAEFKERIGKGETLDKLLPEAFAVCREASVRWFTAARPRAAAAGRSRRSAAGRRARAPRRTGP